MSHMYSPDQRNVFPRMRCTPSRSILRDFLVHLTDTGQTDRCVVRLCRCGKEWTEADVIRAFVFGADCLLDAMRGFPGDAAVADDSSRRRDRHVALAKVNSFRRNHSRD